MSVSRRQFLQYLSPVLAAGVPGSFSPIANALSWSNWSGGQRSNPNALLYPASESELKNLVVQRKGTLRVVGGGHSFSPLVNTHGTIISLEALNGLLRHDSTTLTATFWAGSRIAQASPALSRVGQGFFNEADINMQSFAGAISTATHGTGRHLQSLSAYVTALRLLTPEGDFIDCSPEKDNDVFQAARCGLGTIGIITQITTQNRQAYKLKEVVSVMSLDEALRYVDSHKDQHAHIEFMGFPFGNRAIVKTLDETTDTDTPVNEPVIDENRLLEFAATTAMDHPWTNASLQHLIGMFVSDSTRIGPSYAIYPSPRAVPFNEMEYELPAEQGLDACKAVIDTMRRHHLNVFFPLEFRYVAADSVWMSPFYQRPSVAISVHQYYRQDYHPVFQALEPVFRHYQGRPHWGKLHTLTRQDIAALYPRYADFMGVRHRIDPQGRLLNPYLRALFG